MWRIWRGTTPKDAFDMLARMDCTLSKCGGKAEYHAVKVANGPFVVANTTAYNSVSLIPNQGRRRQVVEQASVSILKKGMNVSAPFD
jgi:hypothetical protein